MRRERPPAPPATLGEVKQEIVRLADQLARLDQSVRTLADRLQAGESAPRTTWDELVSRAKSLARYDHLPEADHLTAVREVVSALRWAMHDVLNELNLIRAHMDAVANDAYLRDEFKAWLKAKPSRG